MNWPPDKNKHTLTDIYYEPGYHTAKLIVNDRIVKTIGVSLPTDKWFFYSKESLSQGLPTYIRPAEPIHNGIIGLEKQDLIDSRIDAQKPQWYLYTYFPSVMEAEGDDFRLKARIISSPPFRVAPAASAPNSATGSWMEKRTIFPDWVLTYTNGRFWKCWSKTGRSPFTSVENK
jgi:hypothetical protein